jgi:hypothetical protein
MNTLKVPLVCWGRKHSTSSMEEKENKLTRTSSGAMDTFSPNNFLTRAQKHPDCHSSSSSALEHQLVFRLLWKILRIESPTRWGLEVFG